MSMNIGRAAATSGVSAKMIRYYESIGLLGRVARTPSGYRIYGADDVHTLRFIRRARDLGFSMAETGRLLALWHDRSRNSAEVKAIASTHIAELERRIGDLKSMKQTLERLAQACHGDSRPDCPILDDLAAATVPSQAPRARHARGGLRERVRAAAASVAIDPVRSGLNY